MEKRWNIVCADETTTGVLKSALKIHPALCRILVNRGINSYESARHFFRPELKDLPDPWLMKDMGAAVDRIQQAITAGEKILVYGDYDVDGTTSVACLYRFLLSIYSSEKIDFYIPHRYREGYGISKAGIDFAVQQGYTLIISLDCGIKSTELITAAKSQGIDFIVCDHHLPDDQLPPAVAILNPKQPGCDYPYKELCGCGIGFKLICALTEKLGLSPEVPHQFLDLVATAIAADIVPMTGENRILAYYGIRKANTSPNYGIKALKDLSGLHTELHISNLVFIIAPRVNAAGRMDDARKAVQLFIAQTPEEAAFYATQLHADNFDRREADRTITEEALASIARNPDWKDRKSTLVYEPHWHKGVVGIVASRLIDHYYRPTIVLTQSGDYASGSARSIPGFNLYEAIHACKDYLVGYGGHFAAAGMTLEIDKVEAFREKFEEVVARTIRPDSLQPGINIDAEVDFKDLTMGFYSILEQMEPFGPDNPRPIFITRKVTDSGNSKIIKEQHIRFAVQQDRCSFSGIGF
ncbi:MAG: single-stranded-DNA-specific exonuclease RecJ [Chitinophagaceae bacterium]